MNQGRILGSVILAILVGMGGGVGALVFRYLIQAGRWLFFTNAARLTFLGDFSVIFLPAIGLVIVTVLAVYVAPEIKGHGVPEVMFAVRRRRGRIRGRVAVIKSLASAITIGSGGSVGREGPIVQIGSGLGSGLGQLLGLHDDQVKLLVACGGAAGIGGTFNAPIAGVIFALEVLLGGFSGRSFGLVVVSSVTSTAIVQAVIGTSPGFPLHGVFALESPIELPLYMVLGVLAGGVSVAYLRAVNTSEDLVDRLRVHPVIKAAVGGLAVGVIGWFGIRYLGGDYLFGVGYEGIEAVLGFNENAIEMTVLVLVAYGVLKIAATTITLAAGGSGGVFAPALFIGAMTGAAFGLTMGTIFPEATAPAGAYAVVGMGAVFAGAARAPMTAVLILFEMTDNYRIILPLMLCVVISYLVSSALSADSIYSHKLRRLGGFDQPGPTKSTLELILVVDAMDRIHEVVRPEQTLSEVLPLIHNTGDQAFPVVGDDGRLVGMVSTMRVSQALLESDAGDLKVKEVMERNPMTTEPGESLYELLRRIGDRDVEAVPVITDKRSKEVVGLILHKHILWAHEEMRKEHDALRRKDSPVINPQAAQVLFTVRDEHHGLVFKHVRDLKMPKRSLIALVQRGNHSVVPRGSTRIDPGDVLVIVCPRKDEPTVRAWLDEVNTG